MKKDHIAKVKCLLDGLIELMERENNCENEWYDNAVDCLYEAKSCLEVPAIYE